MNTHVMILTFILLSSNYCYGLNKNYSCPDGTEIPTWHFCQRALECGYIAMRKLFGQGYEVEDTLQILRKENISCEMKQCAMEILVSDVFLCQNISTCELMNPNFYKCDDGNCEKRSTVCDEDVCNGCSSFDDWPTGIGFKCLRKKKICKLPQQLLYDDIQDCDDVADLCFPKSDLTITNIKPTSEMDTTRCFECMNDGMIIHRTQVCDGVFDCQDLSDECLCDEGAPRICTEIGQYRPISDVTKSPTVYDNPCGFGELKCNNGTCVDAFNVMCNSISECEDNKDEKYEYCKGTLLCSNGLETDKGVPCRCPNNYTEFLGGLYYHTINTNSCKPQEATPCNLLDECPLPEGFGWASDPGYPADECQAKCQNRTEFGCKRSIIKLTTEYHNGFRSPVKCNRSKVENNTQTSFEITVYPFEMCDGAIICTADSFDENEQNCKNRFFCPAVDLETTLTSVNIEMSKKCDGVAHCDDESDESNITCPHRVFCETKNLQKVSLAPSELCDYVIDCENQEDEMNCSDGRFYCEDQKPLFVLKGQTFNGMQDCEDWSDECPTIPPEGHNNIFSSRYELIANPILRALVWIMGLLAIFGNMVVGFIQIKTLLELRNRATSASLKANHILVLNLAISDLLMGMYLILLGGYGLKYAGIFCSVSLQWLTSQTCNMMGILSVLSSESSVITLALLTASRLYSILNPFESSVKPNLFAVVASLILTWTISIVLAFLPLSRRFQGLFVEDALIFGNPFFRHPKVSFEMAKVYVIKLFTFGGNVTQSLDYDVVLMANAWKDLPIVKPDSFFGYYSSQSVCLFKLFVTTNDKSWLFSMIVTSFNFACFMFVCVAYIIIMRVTKRGKLLRNPSSNRKHDKQNDLQKKIIRLIVTDFCCWMPLTIMALINLTLYELPGECYAVAAIVLLPINSALNPILYSNVIDNLVTYFKRKKRQVGNLSRYSMETERIELNRLTS